jgi:hypothetical protein
MKTNRTLNVTVGTTKKSTDTRSFSGCRERPARSVTVASSGGPRTSRPSLWPRGCPAWRAPPRCAGSPSAGPTRHRADEVLDRLGLPGLAWERRAQWSRNLRRCQARTVLGLTKTRTSRQSAQALDSHAQRRRSATLVRGRVGAPLIDGELVAQREDLELESGSRSKDGAERPEEGEVDRLHEGLRLPHLGRTHREFLAGRPPRNPMMTVASAFSGRTADVGRARRCTRLRYITTWAKPPA